MTNAKQPFPSQTADKFIIRLPEGMRDRIAESAVANNRTMTKEIVARLQSSFEQERSLPPDVQEAIEHEMEERGGTAEEAHIRVARTALANGGTLFHATITPQTTIAQFKAMLEASKTIIPPDAAIIMERKTSKAD